jgi:Fe-S-cluster containining protein
MAYARLPLESGPPLQRDSAFSYACAGCGYCCHDMGIRIGPYEILRLARARGLSTTAFIARYTEAGGTMLRNEADGACPFLIGRACAVHDDRPVVCRLYPLGRMVEAGGIETFATVVPHPGSEGRRGQDGTVADFLLRQGVEPFLAIGERYRVLYRRMLDLLVRAEPDEAGRLADRRVTLDALAAGEAVSAWLDIDATVAAFCGSTSQPLPEDLAGLIDLHRAALTEWLDGMDAAV